MSETTDGLIAAMAEQQHGIFTSAHASAIGFTRDERAKRVAAGRWVALHPGVYRMAGAPVSWHGSVMAACWAVRGLTAASHRSGAEVWDLPGRTRAFIEVTTHRYRRAFVGDLVVHETELLRPEDVTTRDGIPVTTVEQTLLGLAAVVSPSIVEMAIDRALHRELTSFAQLEVFLDAKGARGRNGIGVLRNLLERYDPLAGVPESVMETKMKQLLRRHGLPTPQFQYVIRHEGAFVARVDAAYPELRIAIEYDSYEHHTGKDAIVRDNARRNRFKNISWELVTFTAVDFQQDGGDALKALRAARSSASGVAGVP